MFVAINGVRLFFDVLNPKLEIAGDSLREKPVLVCLHGGPGGDHQSLRPFFDRFAALAQVVYLDQRGGGRSEAGDPAGWTLDRRDYPMAEPLTVDGEGWITLSDAPGLGIVLDEDRLKATRVG